LAAPQLSSEITLCAAEKEEPWQMAMGKDKFVGTWKLVSFEARRSDGQVAYPFGRDVIGVINYDTRGNMSVQVMRSDRPAFAVNDFQKGTPEEIRVAFEGFSAYFGTYDVDEEEGTVTHHLKGSWFPNWIGSDQIRFFEFSGNRLTLRTSSIQVGGVVGTSQLIWERMST
jgi:hypothetical protein